MVRAIVSVEYRIGNHVCCASSKRRRHTSAPCKILIARAGKPRMRCLDAEERDACHHRSDVELLPCADHMHRRAASREEKFRLYGLSEAEPHRRDDIG